MKCYKLFLNPKNFVNNFGFYSLSLMFIIQIILLIIYLIKKVKSLKYFLLIYKINQPNIIATRNNIRNNKKKNTSINEPKKAKKFIKKIKTNPPPKNKNFARKSFIKNISNNKLDNKDEIFMKLAKKDKQNLNVMKSSLSNMNSKNNVFVSQNFSPTINIQIPDYNIYKGIKKGINLINDRENNNLNSKNKFKEIILLNEDKNSNMKRKKINKMNNQKRKSAQFLIRPKIEKGYKIKLTKTDSDLQDLDYEEAIIFDKRSCLNLYIFIKICIIIRNLYIRNVLEFFGRFSNYFRYFLYQKLF